MSARPMNGALRGAAAVIAVVALASCSSGADSKDKDAKSNGSASATAVTAAQRLTQTKAVMDKAASMHLVLSSDNVPDKANGVVKGEGVGTHAPAFKGDLTVKVAGIDAGVPVVATGGKVWAKLPFSTGMKTINPKNYGAPDPAVLFSTDKGLSSMLPKTIEPTFGAEKRDGSDVVKTVTGKLSGKDVTDTLTLGDPSRQYDVSYGITSKNELRTVTLTGRFFNVGTSSYTLRLDKYGDTVDIKAPA